MQKLNSKGVISQVHYIPRPLHHIYKKLGYSTKHLKNSVSYYNSALSIPIFYGLKKSQQDRIIKILIKELKG